MWQWWGGGQTIWDICALVPEFPFRSFWERKADRIGAEIKITPLAVYPWRWWHRSVSLWRDSLHQTLPFSRPGTANGKDFFLTHPVPALVPQSLERKRKWCKTQRLFQTLQRAVLGKKSSKVPKSWPLICGPSPFLVGSCFVHFEMLMTRTIFVKLYKNLLLSC